MAFIGEIALDAVYAKAAGYSVEELGDAAVVETGGGGPKRLLHRRGGFHLQRFEGEELDTEIGFDRRNIGFEKFEEVEGVVGSAVGADAQLLLFAINAIAVQYGAAQAFF